jgi:hypothetical protein
MTRNMLRTVNGGGAGRSATVQRGSCPWTAGKGSVVRGDDGMGGRIDQLQDATYGPVAGLPGGAIDDLSLTEPGDME